MSAHVVTCLSRLYRSPLYRRVSQLFKSGVPGVRTSPKKLEEHVKRVVSGR